MAAGGEPGDEFEVRNFLGMGFLLKKKIYIGLISVVHCDYKHWPIVFFFSSLHTKAAAQAGPKLTGLGIEQV